MTFKAEYIWIDGTEPTAKLRSKTKVLTGKPVSTPADLPIWGFDGSSTNQAPGSPGVVVYFECDDLDSTVARLKEGGLRFESDSQDQPWLWREAFLKDPDGNVICLFRAGENRKNPPWRLKRN